MNIEKALTDYKEKKSYVETTIARIGQYEHVLAHPELWEMDIIDEHFFKPINYSGMPGIPRGSGKPDSEVENCLIEKELNANTLKKWIKIDKSRMFIKKLEVEQIEIALEGLLDSERFIIESKYFYNMFWSEIEYNYNLKYRDKNYISEQRLKQINKDVLKKLTNTLTPFYEQFKIA